MDLITFNSIALFCSALIFASARHTHTGSCYLSPPAPIILDIMMLFFFYLFYIIMNMSTKNNTISHY